MGWRDVLRDPVLADFSAVEAGPIRSLVRRGYEAEAALLRGEGAGGEERVAGGRADHPVVTLSGGERAVVRMYRRGGAMRHLNGARYFLGHRALEELRATERARAAGVRAPVVLAAAERRGRVGYTASLATRWIEGATELSGWLGGRGEGEARAALREAGAQIGRLHDAGVGHPDLNLRNLLVSAGPGGEPVVHLIDLDRARLYPGGVPGARRARDLLRLARSARKLRAPVDGRGWEALREGYGAAWPLASPLG